MHHKIGVMQGRLSAPREGKIQSFPRGMWQDEFKKARGCGLDLIEWIFEADAWEENPLWSDAGIAEILQLSSACHVQVLSVCADYFMDRPLLRASQPKKTERLAVFRQLIVQCKKANVRYLTIPYVDASAITSPEELQEAAQDMKACAPLAEANGVTLCLETSLAPMAFAELLRIIDSPHVMVNYDIGNSASLGYKAEEEVQQYGHRIATVHVKDRTLGGGTVPLGTGDADFKTVFAGLSRVPYAGPFILQAARDGDEVETIKRYVQFLKGYLP